MLGGSQIATNTSGVYVKPASTKSYVVEQNLCGTITYDTVKVVVSPTGINNIENFKNTVKIFPNPTTNILNIETEQEVKTITIYNSLGATVFSLFNRVKERVTSLDVSMFTTGIYFLEVKTGNDIIRKKFVKE